MRQDTAPLLSGYPTMVHTVRFTDHKHLGVRNWHDGCHGPRPCLDLVYGRLVVHRQQLHIEALVQGRVSALAS